MSWRSFVCVVLALALLLTGIPLHGQMEPAELEGSEIAQPTESITSSDKPRCPSHESTSTVASPNQDPSSDPEEVGCCGPDCRCQCAGLTLMAALASSALVGQARPAQLPYSIILPASFHLDTPLRPPQV